MVNFTMICPHCGLDVTRASLGKGTQKGKNTKLNSNRKLILAILRQSKKPLAIRDIQRIISEKQIKRESDRGVNWNYHTIQADVSLLVGGEYVKMISGLDYALDNEGYYTEDKNRKAQTPLYIIGEKKEYEY